jgi:hypothetical protein
VDAPKWGKISLPQYLRQFLMFGKIKDNDDKAYEIVKIKRQE